MDLNNNKESIMTLLDSDDYNNTLLAKELLLANDELIKEFTPNEFVKILGWDTLSNEIRSYVHLRQECRNRHFYMFYWIERGEYNLKFTTTWAWKMNPVHLKGDMNFFLTIPSCLTTRKLLLNICL